MNINQKINLSNLVLTAFILMAVGIGFYGLSQETAIVRFVTGPGWQAADGSMETTIGIQRQMLDLNALVDSAIQQQGIDQPLEKLQEAERFTKEAISSMRDSGLIPADRVRQLDDQLSRFEEQKRQLLTAARTTGSDGAALSNKLREFRTFALSIMAFLEELEEFGDSQVEAQIANVEGTESYLKSMLVGAAIGGLIIGLLSVLYTRSAIIRPLIEARDRLRNIAEVDGDLTQQLPVKSQDEIGEFARYFNAFVSKLRSTIQAIERTSTEVQQSAGSLQNTAQSSTEAVTRQAGEIEQVATAINEMTTTIEDVARNAAAAANAAREASQEVQQSNASIESTRELIMRVDQENQRNVEEINNLRSETDSIGSVLEVIRGIAEQTNLLALNAAIEAARAGEQGRGFAVVADEVRTLATRTQQSTEDIQNMIQRLQRGASNAAQAIGNTQQLTNESVQQTVRVAESLREVSVLITKINEMNFQISTATDQQSAVSQDIHRSVETINNGSERVAQNLESNNTASHVLLKNADRLSDLVRQFKV